MVGGQKKGADIAVGSPWAQRGRGGTPRPYDMDSNAASMVEQVKTIHLFQRRIFGFDAGGSAPPIRAGPTASSRSETARIERTCDGISARRGVWR